MAKKRFKDTQVGKFLLDKIPSVVGAIAEDTPVGSVIEAIIGGSDMPKEDKDIALEKLRMEQVEMDSITKRWVADSKSTWLASNVRPLTLVFFSISYVVGWYLNYPLDSITGLLSLIVGAYFGSRGVEKVMGNNKHQ
ncbi:MAG: hypothetical protein Tp139SUR343261_14 [Prokaryotic dsDNA virus sp.]|jgi:hypothetical protein|nr:MAG: hypothetical protein Tp139SUR343261_14 [Prokaryotic dsDNA virus sp.]|tara:strand:+ start:163 stop:573 length:411 start_codon:yes stop_codon:yes gene_type:complete